MTKWQQQLPSDVYNRLCECRNTKEDLPILIKAKWAVDKVRGRTKDDSIVFIFDLLDSNNQWTLCDLTMDEYEELKGELI